ncbi:MAG TPA: hypothetical protein VF533_02680 [Solirubrobacteraceae bacterium]|jgi:hypothetical protein
MALDPTRTLRGALAGAVAAAVWSAQQPLDRRIFGVPYDDTELLGKLVTRGPAWPVVGTAMHVLNGAVFGAVYSAAAPSVPLPAWARGPAAGMLEHLATWPGTRFIDRLHPAGDELPRLWGDPRAFAQATWRHLLFGTVLGELERRLNPPEEPPVTPIDDETVSTNGHGSIEHLVGSPH